MNGNHATVNRYYTCAEHPIICERRAKVLHQMSRQTLKTTDDQTTGSLVVDDEAKSPPA